MNKFALIGGMVTCVAALSVSTALAGSTVVVSIAGEAFDGPPAFDLMIGGKVVGSAILKKAIATEKDGRLFTKPRPSAYLEEFAFDVPDASLLPDKDISISLTNDKFSEHAGQGEDGILDRNLFIDSIRVNGLEITSADMKLTKAGQVQKLDYQAGLLPIYEAGSQAVIKAPAGGWPVSGPAASLMSDPDGPPVPRLASWTKRALDQIH